MALVCPVSVYLILYDGGLHGSFATEFLPPLGAGRFSEAGRVVLVDPCGEASEGEDEELPESVDTDDVGDGTRNSCSTGSAGRIRLWVEISSTAMGARTTRVLKDLEHRNACVGLARQ